MLIGDIENAVEITDGAELGERREPEATPEGDRPAGEKKDDKPVDPELKRVKSELKAERARVREATESAQFWADQARAGKAPVKTDPEPDPLEELGDVDLVNEITENGVKGLDSLLTRLGVARLKDVDQRIVSTRSQITAESALMREYPDLEDDQSPFFKATATIYNSLAQDPHMAKSPKLIATAARLAKAEMASRAGGGGRRRPAAATDADEDLDDDIEDQDDLEVDDERADRVARQAGDRGRARQSRVADENLSDAQKRIVAKFKAVGADISEDGYKKRALSGVRMAGLPRASAGRRR